MQVPREGLELKLQRLSQSQQSIESVSSFCIFYHKDARGVVQVWDTEFYKAPPERKLALLYLANHILQEGRKKGMGFQEEFYKVLPKAVGHMSSHADDKARKATARLVSVWEERRVFGSRHIKSFREVLGPAAAAAAAGSGGGGGGGSSSQRAKAAAGSGGGGGSSSAIAKLGPVGEALSNVLQRSAASSAKAQEFAASWSQNVLRTAGLPEVTAAHSKLKSYSAALTEEVAARRTALEALTAETARQTAEVNRSEAQLKAASGQQQQLEQRMATLTSQMTSAVASLGQLLQQQNGGALAGLGAAPAPAPAAVPGSDAAAAAAAEPPGSPEAPDLEFEDEEGPGGAAQQQAGAAPPEQAQAQPQPPAPDLQALLGDPALLSAAIMSSSAPAAAAGQAAGAGGAVAAATGGAASGSDGSVSLFGGGAAALAPPSGAGGGDSFGGFPALPLQGAASGFADEADDPYELE